MKKKINLFPSKINPFEKIYHTSRKKRRIEKRNGEAERFFFFFFFKAD